MDRRTFLGAAGAAVVVGCTGDAVTSPDTSAAAASTVAATAEAAGDSSLPELDWQMPTSWPQGLDTIFGGAQLFAERVLALTAGRFRITPRAAGEVAPPTQVLDVVEQGAFPIGHSTGYYYIGKSPSTAFGTALPFGLTSRQQNGWLKAAGGLELLQEHYRSRFGVIQFPAGNTGTQMGGWFNKEIASVGDLKGLKMRIPGLGGQVMTKLGVTVQVLPGGEIYQALETGAIDAAEFVGPYDDLKLGLNKIAKWYYGPGWWEPGPSLEVQINLAEWDKLPGIYQEVIKSAAAECNDWMLAKYDVVNQAALTEIVGSGITVLPFPDDVMQASAEASTALLDETAAGDADFKAIYDHWNDYRSGVAAWHRVAELPLLDFTSNA